MISYGKIFRQAYQILTAHKFLWVLGLFLIWGQLGNLFSYSANSTEEMNRFSQQIQKHLALSTFGLILGLMILGILLQLYFKSKAAVIIGTKAIVDKKDTGFSQTFRTSRAFYIRVFGVSVLAAIFIILSILTLAIPVLYLVSLHLQTRAIILGIFAFIILLPLIFLLGFVSNLAPLFVVIHDMTIRESLNASFEMARKFWPTLLVFSLFLGLLMAAVSIILSLTLGLGVVILGHLFYDTGGFTVSAGSITLGIVGFAAFLFFGSGIASFQQISWFILFNELVRPEKLAEEETLPVPEIV